MKYGTRSFQSNLGHVSMTRFSPFPGKNPVRLFIRVWISDLEKGKRYTRYAYHGAWTFAAIKRAQRVFNEIDPNCRTSYVVEYGAIGRLYSGNLQAGLCSKLRPAVFVDWDNPYQRQVPMHPNRNSVYCPTPVERVKRKGVYLYFRTPLESSFQAKSKLAFQQYRKSLEG